MTPDRDTTALQAVAYALATACDILLSELAVETDEALARALPRALELASREAPATERQAYAAMVVHAHAIASDEEGGD